MPQVRINSQKSTQEENLFLIRLALMKKKEKEEKELGRLKKEFRMLIIATDEPLPINSLQVNRHRRERLEKDLLSIEKYLRS